MTHVLRKAVDVSATVWGYTPLLRKLAPAPNQPPLLVLSLPRSGSSWIGSLLGASRQAAYMREPFSAAHRKHGGRGALFDVQESDAEMRHYRQAIDQALRGIPAFPHSVLRYPDQWRWSGRADRRIVIKEINPFCLPYLTKTYTFDTIFILRHPLAIVQSFAKLGWWDRTKPDACIARLSDCWLNALEQLAYQKHLVLKYEDFCKTPETAVQEVLHWAGLDFDDRVREVLQTSIGTGDRSDTYSTVRNPHDMASAWKADFSQAEADVFYHAYKAFPHKYYSDPAEWSVA